MQTFFTIGLKAPRPILLCPGPVLLSSAVKRAVLSTDICHREMEFSQLLVQSSAMVKTVVGASDRHEVAFITGSGTAANETILSSVGTLGPVLIISNGEFGERLLEVASLHNTDVDQVCFAWQEKIDLKKVEAALRSKHYFMVMMVHHETSSGMLNPIAAVAKIAHRYGALIAVDAISSIGAEELAVEAWNIDILVGTSGKALSAMPGVGILVVATKVLNKLRKPSANSHYLDLYKHFHYMRTLSQTPNTPAVHVFVSLHASLLEITRLGVNEFQAVINDRAIYCRKELLGMGLAYADYEGSNSRVITCVTLPSYLTFHQLAKQLKQKGIVVYNGKGVLKDKLFQIGHIGALRKNDTAFALYVIKKILKQQTIDDESVISSLEMQEVVPSAIS